MAIAVANRQLIGAGVGGLEFVTADVTLDTAYVAGGSLGLAAALGLSAVLALIPLTLGGYVHEYTPATDALKTSWPTGGGTNPGAPASQPAITAGATAMTSSAANGTNDITAGQSKEVVAAANLSGTTIKVLAIGRA